MPTVRGLDPTAYRLALAAELRAELARQRKQQSELLRAFGWEKNWLSKRMNGQVDWSQGDFMNLCDYLGIDKSVIETAAKKAALRGDGPLEDGQRAAV